MTFAPPRLGNRVGSGGRAVALKDASVRARLCAGSPPTQRTAAAERAATRPKRGVGGGRSSAPPRSRHGQGLSGRLRDNPTALPLGAYLRTPTRVVCSAPPRVAQTGERRASRCPGGRVSARSPLCWIVIDAAHCSGRRGGGSPRANGGQGGAIPPCRAGISPDAAHCSGRRVPAGEADGWAGSPGAKAGCPTATTWRLLTRVGQSHRSR
jgi:hypothetical protein